MPALNNVIRFARSKEMWWPYFRWVAARAVLKKPRICLGNDASIGEWINFSEYYYFYHHGISVGELCFLRRVREEAGNGECVGLDVGANVGLFTCTMADADFTRVHSFEPIPDTFVRLKRNVLHNGINIRCNLNCLGVGAVRGLAQFAEDIKSPGVNRLATSATRFAHQIQQVPVIPLDEYCSHYQIRTIDLAKIDVEGMEELVLRGAKELMQRRAIKKILIEIAPVNQPQVGLHIDGLLTLISELGYEPHKLLEDGIVGEKLDNSYLRNCLSENVILVPRK
jgi:FkbM family methyltransferase